MAITPQYPSGYNTYVPNTQATNNLIIDFARNIDQFKLNQYTQTIKVSENVGMYTRMTNEVCARFLNSNDSVWADATERPLGNQNLESFANETYRTIRRTFPVTLGYLSTQQASWNMTATTRPPRSVPPAHTRGWEITTRQRTCCSVRRSLPRKSLLRWKA